MERILPFFYGLVYAGLSFFGITQLLSYLSKKRYERYRRRLKAHEEYMSIRRMDDRSFIEEWDQIEVYAQWLRDRMVNKAGGSGRHVQCVTDEEIKELIKECRGFIKHIDEAVCKEDRILKKLRSKDELVISADEHNRWHWMFPGAGRIKLEFEVLLKNRYRNRVR